jgi:hypothetical protein
MDPTASQECAMHAGFGAGENTVKKRVNPDALIMLQPWGRYYLPVGGGRS